MGRKITLKKVLYHPLAWIAIGLHVLLLGLPLGNGAPTNEVLEPEESNEEAVPVDILNLSEITSSTPPDQQPPSADSPKPAAAPSSVPPTAIPPTTAPAPASNSVPASDQSTDVPFESTAGTDAGAEQDAPPPPAFDPAQVQGVFLSNLGSLQLEDYTDEQGLPPANFFRQPENAAYFPHEAAPTMSGVVNARWLNKGSAELLNELQTNYAPSGVQFTKLQDYGGEELYELTTPEGQPFLYVSIVRLKGSSLMVTWEQPPV